MNRLACQVTEEVKLATAGSQTCRDGDLEEERPKETSVLRKLFKRTYCKARAQATTRVECEWMVDRMSELSGDSKWCILQNRVAMELILNTSLCKGPTPNCNFSTVNRYRTIDGTCNNLIDPTLGAAFTPFRRLLSAVYEDGIGQPVGFQQAFKENRWFDPPRPSPRFISLNIIEELQVNQPQATYMLMQWGQFLDHDYAYLIESSTLSGEEIECNTCTPMGECVPIPVPKDDPQFGVGTIQNGNCLSFIRAGASCVRPRGGPLFGPREQLNQITHWIDASNVYGSLPEEEKELRAFRNGLLREGPDRTLPVDPDPRLECPGTTPCFLGGDLRANEQVVLTVMHTIFLREHNRIARQLGALNPEWDDERIYQEARKIVGAIAQVITYQEYLPEILGRDNLDCLLGEYTGYDPNIDGSLPNSFAAAAYRIGHSQIQEAFTRINVYGNSLSPLYLVDAFFNPQAFFDNGGTDSFLRGLLTQQSSRIDEFVTSTLTNRLFERPGEAGTDLASLNIQRGRDHGLPSYKTFRNFCTTKFGLRGQIENPETLWRLRKVYNSEDDIDLWVGGLAETPLPGAIIGPTFACIFAITFRGLREGDRFYYENPGVFTPAQLNEIKNATLSRIICDNGNDIRIAQPNAFNAFQPPQECWQLPFIDLTPWQEWDMCYIQAVVISNPRAVATLYTQCSGDRRCQVTDQLVTRYGSSNVKTACLKFTCPTVNDNCPIEIRTRTRASLCEIVLINSNALNPNRNTALPPFTYLGTANPDFKFPRTLESCQRSNKPIIKFFCQG